MKKVFSYILFIALILSMTACTSSQGPEKVVDKAMQAIKAMDKEELSKYMDIDDLLGDDDSTINTEAISEEEVSVLFENIDYKINSSNIDGDSAIVNLDIENIDMGLVLGQFLEEAFTFAFSDAFSDNSLSDEEMEAAMTDLFLEIIEKNKDNTVSNNVDVGLNKVDGQWKIDIDEDFQNALTGNLIDMINSMGDIFGDFE